MREKMETFGGKIRSVELVWTVKGGTALHVDSRSH